MASVFLFEDDVENLRLLKRLLEHHGHEISAAQNVEDGLASLESLDPDVILMDMEMPLNRDSAPQSTAGLTAVSRLRATERMASVPIIALSAHSMAKQKSTFEQAGCNDFQEKPIFPFESLLQKIDKWCPDS